MTSGTSSGHMCYDAVRREGELCGVSAEKVLVACVAYGCCGGGSFAMLSCFDSHKVLQL